MMEHKQYNPEYIHPASINILHKITIKNKKTKKKYNKIRTSKNNKLSKKNNIMTKIK